MRDATIRKIKEESPELAIICDCRFPNEVDGIKKAGGKTIRLTRNDESPDVHESEPSLAVSSEAALNLSSVS